MQCRLNRTEAAERVFLAKGPISTDENGIPVELAVEWENSQKIGENPNSLSKRRSDRTHLNAGVLMAKINEATKGKIRDKPINDKLRHVLTNAADAAGIDIVRVTSGGQDAKGSGGQRIGSTRHDHGNAADLQLIKNGRKLDFTGPDRPIVAAFVTAAAANGATGIGAGVKYMGPTILHVGFGSRGVWGEGGRAKNAPKWLRKAAHAGWSMEARILGDEDDDLAPCCGGRSEGVVEALAAAAKPAMTFDPSPYHTSRGGVAIDHIVVHYTTTRSFSSTINHFKDNPRGVSTHYVISRKGRIVQMVKDKRRCIHANSKNARSIGIEHSAAQGDKITPAQEASSIALIKWLMQKHGIKQKKVICHKCAPRATLCPGELFLDYGANGHSSCAEHTKALQKWLNAKL